MNFSARRSVLIVEDDSVVAFEIQKMVGNLGYDAFAIASSGEEALTRAQVRRPDTVLMKLRMKMPLDGITAAETLQKHMDVPVIYLTADADTATIDAAKSMMTYGYLRNPITAAGLRSAIEFALYKHDTSKTLQVTDQRIERAIRGTRDGIFEWQDGENRGNLWVSPRWWEILGYDLETSPVITAAAMTEMIHPDDRTFVTDALAAAAKSGEPISLEHRMRTRQDEWVWVHLRSVAIRSADGRTVVSGSMRDITPRKRAEENLRTSLASTRALYELTGAMISHHDLVDLLQAVVNTVADILPAESVALVTFDLDMRRVVHCLRGGVGAKQLDAAVTFDELLRGSSGWVMRELLPALVPKTPPDSRERRDVDRRTAETLSGDVIVVPLICQNRLLGTMTAVNSPDGAGFGQKQVDLMMSIASHAAIAMTTAELYTRLQLANESLQHEIADRKRADERFRLAIEAAPTGMLLMNLTGSIVLINAQIEQLFGYSREELLGKQIEMLVPERFRVHHPDFRVAFFAAPAVRKMGAGRELYGLRKDGTEVPIEIGLNPLHTSEGDFVLSSIVDLSQRRAIERLRTDFVSTVSHELRTPLTSISGSLGLLQSGAMGTLSEKAESMIRIAYKNSARLVRIINDILDIGKLEAGQLALQIVSISLSELLQQAIEGNSSYAQKYEVRFVLDGAPESDRVMADPDRLMQVVTNLLSNAAKFSPPGADVLIRVLPGESTTRVEVQDFGPGIDDAFKDRIFEKFAQADASASRRFEGTGLGLSIARKLVEAMGGSIGFTTVIRRGTTFYFELPRTEAAPAVRRVESLSDTDVHRALRESPVLVSADTAVQRVLYIEQVDDDLVTVVRATLAGRADIVLAHGLWDAKRLLNQEHFDLIVLDETSSDRDAIGRTDPIADLVVHAVPIVVLSGRETPQPISSFVGATLVKSQVSPAHVAATILSYLSPPIDFS